MTTDPQEIDVSFIKDSSMVLTFSKERYQEIFRLL